ncbi:MAG: cation diffusion facilitator family transporter [Candidatus Micrarchaeota archaeon]
MNEDRGLGKVFLVSCIVLIVQLFGWYYSNSLALLGDSAHVFSDIIAIGASLLAIKLALKLPTSRRTFGFHRAEVFAALFNGALLVVMAIVIAYEAFTRFGTIYEINSVPMLFTSFIGLLGNLYVVYQLQHDENLNVRSAFLHAAGDALSSIGVMIGAILILFTGQYVIDIIISLIISVLILFGAYRILRSSLSILLESAPYGVSVEKIEKTVMTVDKVKGVHDIHVWRTCSEFVFAMMHIEVTEQNLVKLRKMQLEIEKKLHDKYEITHVTIQFEPYGCSCRSEKMCHLLEHKKGHSH